MILIVAIIIINILFISSKIIYILKKNLKIKRFIFLKINSYI